VIPYRAMLDVPAELLRYLSRLLAAERRRRGTPAKSRKLSCRDQAVLALRWFRDRTRIEALGRDHGVSRATAYRYVAEAVDVLSARAPGLAQALERAMAEGAPFVVLDGKVFETDRLTETVTSVKGEDINAWYSGKKHRPGASVQAVMLPGGLPIWAGPAEPGHVHDITAARAHALPALCRHSPTAATREPASASASRSRTPAGTSGSTPTRKPATACSTACAARENEGSPSSPSAGPPSSASPPAPGEPPR
jgi:hypothetical protein